MYYNCLVGCSTKMFVSKWITTSVKWNKNSLFRNGPSTQEFSLTLGFLTSETCIQRTSTQVSSKLRQPFIQRTLMTVQWVCTGTGFTVNRSLPYCLLFITSLTQFPVFYRQCCGLGFPFVFVCLMFPLYFSGTQHRLLKRNTKENNKKLSRTFF